MRRVGLAASLAFVAIGTPLVPYLFPPSRDILGVSAEVGFNNAVAYWWYVASVLVAAIALARLLPAGIVPPAPSLDGVRSRVPWRIVGLVSGAHVVVFAAVFAYKGRFVFSEGLYFQALLHRMSFGEVPYVDFSYYYGPLMLYPGHWLGQLFGLEAGYAIAFVLTYVVGLVLLAVVLAAFLGSRRAVAWWFVLLAVGLVNPFTGVNFTFTRYLLATVSFLLAARLFAARRPSDLPLAALSLSAAILYGFEVAALSVGSIVLLAAACSLQELYDRTVRLVRGLVGASAPPPRAAEAQPGPASVLARGAALLAIGLAAAGAAFYALDGSGRALAGFADSSVAFLSGAHNQPVYANALFLTLAAVTVLGLAVALLAVASAASRAAGATVGAYAVLALTAQRASFSATDYNHIIFFGLPAVLLALVGVERIIVPIRRDARVWASLVLVAGFIVPMQSYQVAQLAPALFVARGAASPAVTPAALPPTAPIEDTLARAVTAAGVDHPYVMYGLDYYSLPVYRRLGLRFAGHDTIFNSARTPELVDALVERVRRAGAYVVMTTADYEGAAATPRVEPFWNAYSIVTGAPMPGSDVQRLNYESLRRLHDRFVESVRRDYRPVRSADGIVVLAPAGR